MARRKTNIAEIDRGWLVYADMFDSQGKDYAGPHYAIVLTKKEEIDVDDRMDVVPISHNASIADPLDMVPVDPSYGLNKNCYAICSWMIPGLLHRNAIIRAHKPGVDCDAFLLEVMRKAAPFRRLGSRSPDS